MMDLRHHSTEPFDLANWQNRSQGDYDLKPHGLWISVDDDWRRWCEDEEYGLGRYEYRIKLSEDANILTLPTVSALDDFNREYGWQQHSINWIRWSDVAVDYHGIIIAPYHWERRLSDHTRWYYGWDCASGCIWDSAAIESVALVEQVAS